MRNNFWMGRVVPVVHRRLWQAGGMSVLPEVPDHALRVTAGQRDNTVAILRDAAADGRLNFDELDNRVGDALRAVTRENLAAVLSDLVPVDELGSALATGAPLGDGPGYRWEEPLLIRGQWRSTTKRDGRWELPPFVEINTDSVGSVRLDMTRATVRSLLIDLVITSSGGTVTLVIPDGWGVDTMGLQTDGMGATISSRVPTRPSRGAPRIVVRGRTAGSLKVRYPTRRELARNR
ncbi:MAG: DUF1707 domain-containing protein [Propionibacteriaceae bacterium]|nr:DUF1707 domain-containing protein [Propionibacteriaceae bacterium]